MENAPHEAYERKKNTAAQPRRTTRGPRGWATLRPCGPENIRALRPLSALTESEPCGPENVRTLRPLSAFTEPEPCGPGNNHLRPPAPPPHPLRGRRHMADPNDLPTQPGNRLRFARACVRAHRAASAVCVNPERDSYFAFRGRGGLGWGVALGAAVGTAVSAVVAVGAALTENARALRPLFAADNLTRRWVAKDLWLIVCCPWGSCGSAASCRKAFGKQTCCFKNMFLLKIYRANFGKRTPVL
jgi:hypothetical protein